MDHEKDEGDELREELRNHPVLGRWNDLSSAWLSMVLISFEVPCVLRPWVHEIHVDPSDKFLSFCLKVLQMGLSFHHMVITTGLNCYPSSIWKHIRNPFTKLILNTAS